MFFCFVLGYVCELFSELVGFLFGCYCSVVFEGYCVVCYGCWFFVGYSVDSLPQYVCISSVVPVSVKMLFPYARSLCLYGLADVLV